MFAHFALAAAALTKVLHVDFLLLKNYAVPLDKDLVDKIGKAKQIALWGGSGIDRYRRGAGGLRHGDQPRLSQQSQTVSEIYLRGGADGQRLSGAPFRASC